MNSVCGKLDSIDGDTILGRQTLNGKKCSKCLKLLLHTCSEDVQESDGDDTGNIKETGREKDPSSGSSPPPDEEDEDDFASALQLIFYEPQTSVRLISAMKGSREKQGMLARKLSVKWAADVYDPPPSLSSHTRCKIQPQPRSKSKDGYKRNGKKGQKGSSNSSSRKDKKHSSRNKHGRDQFHVGNTEALCAGSFLRSNPTKVHLSVAAQAL